VYQSVSVINSIRFSDFIDILVVMWLIYVILAILRQTRASAALRGLIGVVATCMLIYTVSVVFNLTTTRLLFERFWIVIVLVFLILFQNEFRRALTEFGQVRVFRRFFARGGLHLEELLKAVRTFSRAAYSSSPRGPTL
jgi:diadenylate cyclase